MERERKGRGRRRERMEGGREKEERRIEVLEDLGRNHSSETGEKTYNVESTYLPFNRLGERFIFILQVSHQLISEREISSPAASVTEAVFNAKTFN